MKRRYCGPCDEYTNSNPCAECGAETDRVPEENPREKGDGDGREYGHPGDRLAGIE